MFAVKAGSVTVLLAGDRAAGAIEVPPLRMSALREANQATLERFTNGVRTLFFRYLRLGIRLTVVYAIIGAAYIAFVFGPSIPQALDSPLMVTLASLSVLVAITLVNFLYLLMQIVMAAENCGVLEAMPHVARLLRRRREGARPGARGDPRVDADGDRRVDSRHHAAGPDRVCAVRRPGGACRCRCSRGSCAAWCFSSSA